MFSSMKSVVGEKNIYQVSFSASCQIPVKFKEINTPYGLLIEVALDLEGIFNLLN